MSLKAITDMVGYEIADEKDFDAAKFKEYFDGKFVTKEAAIKDPEITKTIAGSIFGGLNAKAKKMFGLTESEIKDKDFDQILEAGKGKFEAEKKTLQEQIGKSADERVSKLEKDLEFERTAKTDLEGKLTEFTNQHETVVNGLKGEVKNVKKTTKFNDLWKNTPFTDDFVKNDILQEGFKSKLEKKYTFDLDDKDEFVVTDKEGKPVKHPKVSHKMASAEDILTFEAETNGFLKKNNAQAPVRKTFLKKGDDGTPIQGDESKVHPNALKHAKKLAGA